MGLPSSRLHLQFTSAVTVAICTSQEGVPLSVTATMKIACVGFNRSNTISIPVYRSVGEDCTVVRPAESPDMCLFMQASIYKVARLADDVKNDRSIVWSHRGQLSMGFANSMVDPVRLHTASLYVTCPIMHGSWQLSSSADQCRQPELCLHPYHDFTSSASALWNARHKALVLVSSVAPWMAATSCSTTSNAQQVQ